MTKKKEGLQYEVIERQRVMPYPELRDHFRKEILHYVFKRATDHGNLILIALQRKTYKYLK